MLAAGLCVSLWRNAAHSIWPKRMGNCKLAALMGDLCGVMLPNVW